MERYDVKQIEFCADENCEIESQCAECILETFKYTEEGVKLASMEPRFGDFAWDDKDRFAKYFGSDVNPFYHGYHQAKQITMPFIAAQNVSVYQNIPKEDARALFIANVTHDFHEGLVGDIALPDKLARGSSWAKHELDMNLELVARSFGVSRDHAFINKLEEVQSGDHFLSRAFKAMEYLGYHQTGLRAWALKDWVKLSDKERASCHDLGKAVLVGNTPTLEKLAPEFIYVDQHLSESWSSIVRARA